MTDPGLVPYTVASALSVREVANEDIVITLRHQLRERSVLILLDNCEHLVSVTAALAGDVAANCPGVLMLSTSREPLGIAGVIGPNPAWLVSAMWPTRTFRPYYQVPCQPLTSPRRTA